jgi:hypothetical protein
MLAMKAGSTTGIRSWTTSEKGIYHSLNRKKKKDQNTGLLAMWP